MRRSRIHHPLREVLAVSGDVVIEFRAKLYGPFASREAAMAWVLRLPTRPLDVHIRPLDPPNVMEKLAKQAAPWA